MLFSAHPTLHYACKDVNGEGLVKHIFPSCRLHLRCLSGCLIHENVSQSIWKRVDSFHPLPETQGSWLHAGGWEIWSRGRSAWQRACEVCCAWIKQNCAKTEQDGIFPGLL